ncbi:MAG: hypothetical protein IBJ11_06140 [Phycisphaerales bacterium]|nr:hypothetical protein [Phycisphaerales bacterium]
MLSLAAVAALIGCAGKPAPPPADPNAEARRSTGTELFGGTWKDDAQRSGFVVQDHSARVRGRQVGWSILLESLRDSGDGPAAQRAAQQRLDEIAEALGRSDLRLQRERRGWAIVAGSYNGPSDPKAQADLKRLQDFEINGSRPFSRAFLAPPPAQADPGKSPENNLAKVRELIGDEAKYTLQIAVYESPDREEAKRAAESAAAALRAEGEQAFYYHGPRRSMVTVGVFGPRDINDKGVEVSPVLAALRQKYPHNLMNGREILERSPGAEARRQPSTLVAIPAQ